MSKFVHIHVGGRWVEVPGPCRCTECGGMAQATWRYFPEPSTWTLALCAPCVDKNTKEEA